MNSQAAERNRLPDTEAAGAAGIGNHPGNQAILATWCWTRSAAALPPWSLRTALGASGAGIDLSPLAIKLVNDRIIADRGKDGTAPLWGGATALDRPSEAYRSWHHPAVSQPTPSFLYGKQIGNCAGCGVHFPFSGLTVDHILPRSRGGTDHLDNLQLLCLGCDSSKGKPHHARMARRTASQRAVTTQWTRT